MKTVGGDNEMRFDVIEIILDENYNKLQLKHTENAF